MFQKKQELFQLKIKIFLILHIVDLKQTLNGNNQINGFIIILHSTYNNNNNFEPLRDDPPPLYNQRVIQADIERTRPTMKCFQDSAIRHEME